jgi:subtilisin family serine protease
MREKRGVNSLKIIGNCLVVAALIFLIVISVLKPEIIGLAVFWEKEKISEDIIQEDMIKIDLSDKREFKVGDFNINLITFEDYIRVNLVNNEENNYIVYHLTNPPPSQFMNFVDSEGNTQIILLENIPAQRKTEQLVSQKYGKYKNKIEDVLFDEKFLEKKGYKKDNKIPVIISLDIPIHKKQFGVMQKRNAFNEAKNKLLETLKKKRGIFGIAGSFKAKDLEIIEAVAFDVTAEDLDVLRDLDIVNKVSLDKRVYAFLYDSVGLINATDLWKIKDSEGRNITGQNTTVAVIDTGVDYTHVDLGGCFGAGCKVIGGYDFVNDDNNPMDDHGHGTHCAGIAAGNGTLKGAAPDAKIYAYKVLDSGGSGSFSDVIAGIQRAADPDDDGDYTDHVDVISMSLGGWGNPDDEVSQAVDAAVDAGVVAVIAAGNEGPSPESIGSPGCARKALTVGATCKPGQVGVHSHCDEIIARFSSRGPTSIGGIKPDVVAPGVDICAAQWNDAWEEYECIDDEHTAISGTSMATPHVAGAAALLLQAHSDWNPSEVKSALMLTAEDLGFNANTQGTGQINVLNAYNSSIATEPQSISFGHVSADDFSQSIDIKNLKDYTVNLSFNATLVSDELGNNYSIASLNVSDIVIEGNSQESILLIINLTEGIEGSFEGRIIINETGRNYSIPFSFVKLSRLTLSAKGDKPLYPDLLLHNDDFTIKRGLFQGAVFEGDSYTFMIPSGNYTVYAAGDSEDLSTEYILIDTVEVGIGAEVNKTLNMSDARPFTIKARALDGTELKLYSWEKAFISYKGDKTYSYSFIDPNYGDRTVYISNKPDNGVDTDVIFDYYGIPSDTPFEGEEWGKTILGKNE